jgi:ferredoxin
MRVQVDTDICEANGECVFAAPEIFELDDEEQIHWVESPDERLREMARTAEKLCPVSAIRVTD